MASWNGPLTDLSELTDDELCSGIVRLERIVNNKPAQEVLEQLADGLLRTLGGGDTGDLQLPANKRIAHINPQREEGIVRILGSGLWLDEVAPEIRYTHVVRL